MMMYLKPAHRYSPDQLVVQGTEDLGQVSGGGGVKTQAGAPVLSPGNIHRVMQPRVLRPGGIAGWDDDGYVTGDIMMTSLTLRPGRCTLPWRCPPPSSWSPAAPSHAPPAESGSGSPQGSAPASTWGREGGGREGGRGGREGGEGGREGGRGGREKGMEGSMSSLKFQKCLTPIMSSSGEVSLSGFHGMTLLCTFAGQL